MFEEEIIKIKDYNEELDVKLAGKLSIEQFGNLLCVLSDKGLIDETEAAKKVDGLIKEVFAELEKLLDQEMMAKAERNRYIKSYNKLLQEVKIAFDLEPAGSIQERTFAAGIALGTGIGVAMSVGNPERMSIGIGLGLVIGAAVGRKKEAAAKEAGKLF